jgi:hypothetical protein
MESFQELLERWMAGEHLPGVRYALTDRVEVAEGAHAGERGVIAAAVDFAPEPVFVVDLDAGTDVEVSQSSVRPAD